MTRHRWRESIKSYFGNHIDIEKTEEQEKNRTDVENKMMKILKLIKEIKNEEEIPLENLDKGSEIVDLVEDIHKQYESLHSLYSHLTGELRRKAHYKEKSDGSSSSSSSSDSESDHSSKVKMSKNHNGESEFHKLTESLKHELGDTNLKLTALSEEKDALGMKIQEAEKIIEDLRKTEAELNQKLGDTNKEKDALSMEKSKAFIGLEEGQKLVGTLQSTADQLKEENGSLKQELETVKGEVLGLNQQVASLNQVLEATRDENNVLASKNSEILLEIEKAHGKIQELKNESKQLRERLENREEELSALLKKYSDLESEASAERNGLEAQISDLRLELDLVSTQRRELIESGTTEATKLKEEILNLQVLKTELQDRVLVLERKSNEREEELSAALNNLQLEVDSLKTQKSEYHKLTESLKHELGAMNRNLIVLNEEKEALGLKILEAEKIIEDLRMTAADLNQKFGDTEKEKEALSTENLTALIRIEEGQKIMEVLQSKADQLKEENGTLKQELETVKEEVLHLNQQLESANHQVVNLTSLNNVLGATQEENNAKNSETLVEIKKAQEKIQELTDESKQLKERLANKENEISTLLKKYSDLESETSDERMRLAAQIAGLRVEFDLAGTQERELKQQIESGTNEAMQLNEEILCLQVLKTELQYRILVLERKSNEREEELSAALNNLQLEVESLSTQKIELEEQLKAKTSEAEKFRDENSQLQLQQTTLQEQISALDISLKLKEENALMEVNALKEQVENLQHELIEFKDALRRAVENENILHERLQVSENEKTEETEKKQTKFAEIQILQSKQRELHSEISRLQEENSNSEVTIRLLNRRLVVTEQLLSEREKSHRQAETYFHQERNSLLERIAEVTEEVDSAKHDLREVKESIVKAFNAFTDLEVATQSSLADQTSNENRILKFSEELQNAKRWVTGIHNENEKLQKSVGSLVEELGEKKERELELQKKLENLKVTVDKEHEENERLWNKVEELEKNVREMKEMTICREEEKREAIRQLCLWVDYRTENYDRLKQMLSQMSRRNQRLS